MQHIGQFMGELIVGLDGEEHRTYRNLVAKAFRQSQLEKWDSTLVRPLIEQLVDEVTPKGHAELVADITSKYPVQVICGIAGVPIEDADQLAQWAVEINTGPLDPPKGFAAKQAMTDYLRPLIDQRTEPRRPATSSPTSCTPRLTANGYAMAGMGRTCASCCRPVPRPRIACSAALYALLSHPDVMEPRVQADPSLIHHGGRGDVALGDVGDDGEPRRDTRHRGGRLPDPQGRARGRGHGRSEP